MTEWFAGDEITYFVSDCLLGKVLVAQTATGVCGVLLGDSELADAIHAAETHQGQMPASDEAPQMHQPALDACGIDGRYIRDLQHGGREATFVKHLVNMYAELNVRTLAEMVETTEAQDAVRAAGVHFAQGWLYGRATETPVDAETIEARCSIQSGALRVRSALDR